MDKKRLRDILCACAVMLMLPCGASIIRGMSVVHTYERVDAAVPQDSLELRDSAGVHDSLSADDSLAISDSTVHIDSLSAVDSVSVGDSLLLSDSTADSTVVDSVVVYTERQLRQMARDSIKKQKDAVRDSIFLAKQAVRDSVLHIRDSLKSVKDSIRWSKPRVLETGFVPDSMYYQRIMSWNTGPYINEYRHAHMDTTFNDWYTEYPFYKEDIDAVYLGTVGSATQNVNFFKRREFDRFKAYAPYLTYSHVPEDAMFFNVKAPYTELAYWGTLFAYKAKEETNVRFLHTQNITPAFNLAVLFQGWKAAGMLNREATTNNSLELTGNYLGKSYVANFGLIHHNITRQENGGVQDPYMVRDTTVDGKTIAVNLQNAQNKLSRNTFFIDHSYNIPLESKSRRMHKAMEADTSFAAKVDSIVAARISAYEAAVAALAEADSLAAAADSLSAEGLSAADSSVAESAGDLADASGMPEPGNGPEPDTLVRPTVESIIEQLADSLLFGSRGDGPMLTVGHMGEVSRYYRYYTDEITDEVGRNFYNNMFYINPVSSADSTRVLTVDNKIFFKLQPWARDAVVSEITGGLGYQWNSVYAFTPEMFLTGNRNIHQHNAYVYAGARGQYRKYLNWDASANYNFLGYNLNDFEIDAGLDVSFYPFKDKTEPITLSGRFNTSLKEPDWYSQHYYSNHYVWDNDFGKTSKTRIEAMLEIPKWNLEASFTYGLVSNYLYNDTLGVIRQHNGLVNVMSGYVRKDFKLWWFHFDNKILFQYSSNKDVLPLPMLTFHMRYYIELEAVKNVLKVQLGADATMNTPYYAPAYNPALGTFQLQTRELIGYNPYIDLFLNLQWKRVNVFLKVVNIGQGWPDGGNMFSAYHYIKPYRGFKFGIHWPFYIE